MREHAKSRSHFSLSLSKRCKKGIAGVTRDFKIEVRGAFDLKQLVDLRVELTR